MGFGLDTSDFTVTLQVTNLVDDEIILLQRAKLERHSNPHLRHGSFGSSLVLDSKAVHNTARRSLPNSRPDG